MSMSADAQDAVKRVLVIGGGSIGERHVRCFQRTGRADVSLCEIRADLRERLRSRYGLVNVYADMDETAGVPFDAAVVCTPADIHLPVAIALAARGIHLLIEKPLSTSLAGVDELQRLRGEHRLVVAVAYVLRGHPALQRLKELMDSGVCGATVQLLSQSGQHFPLYRPAYRETYYTRHETGGGAIQDALTHSVNAAEFLVGNVTSLAADARHCVLPGVDVEDTVLLMARHGNVLSSFTLNQHQYPLENQITLICERGAFRADLVSNRLLSCTEPGAAWSVESEYSIERDDLFVAQANHFLDCVAGTARPWCTLEQGEQTLRTSLAVLQSAGSGQRVEMMS